MEYLTDLVTTVPEGTSPVKVDELRAAEAVRAAELAKAGHLVRLWRPPLGPGEWRSIGLSCAADEAEPRSPRLVTSSYLDEGHYYAAEFTSQ
jgi:muconolactone D-isomerase